MSIIYISINKYHSGKSHSSVHYVVHKLTEVAMGLWNVKKRGPLVGHLPIEYPSPSRLKKHSTTVKNHEKGTPSRVRTRVSSHERLYRRPCLILFRSCRNSNITPLANDCTGKGQLSTSNIPPHAGDHRIAIFPPRVPAWRIPCTFLQRSPPWIVHAFLHFQGGRRDTIYNYDELRTKRTFENIATAVRDSELGKRGR